MNTTSSEHMLGRYNVIGVRPDGSELVLWSEPEREDAQRQLEVFRAQLEGYAELRIDEISDSPWRINGKRSYET